MQSSVFRTLIDATKEIVVDANIVFDPRGILVKTIDESCNAMIHMRLNGDKFEEYICTGTFVCGVSLLHLYKLLKTMSTTDVLMMYQRKGTNDLGIRIEHNKRAKTNLFKLHLLDLNKREFEPFAPEFDQAIRINSSEFHKIIREMKDISPQIDIRCHDTTLSFKSVNGSFADAEMFLAIAPNEGSRSSKLVQGIFCLRYLSMFTKCTPLSRDVNIYLKNDYPLILQYQVSDLGMIQLVLMMEDRM